MLNMHISRYVALHRSLGRKFSAQERLLRQYADFAERSGDRHTQVQRIYDWCHTSSSQYVARRRFDTVRNFSLFARAEDLGHEVPPAGVFGRGKRPRPTPTIIEPDQVQAIMTAALDVPPQDMISPHDVRVRRIVDETSGQSRLGRIVSAQMLSETADSFNVADTVRLSPGEIIAGAGAYEGAPVSALGDARLLRVRVNNDQRLELRFYPVERLDWLKSLGCFTEIISFRTRLFLPPDQAERILAAIG